MKILFAIAVIFFVQKATAGDIKWQGNYRFEALKIFNPDLNDSDKTYALHHFTLKPEFIAYDGLTIHARFDILNHSRFPNDQLGQTLGAGPNPTPGTPLAPSPGNPGSGTNATNSNISSDQLGSDSLAVNEIYVNWSHEFGVLTVGRTPMHFGLGMNFNGGFGLFDHWLENRDIVAYKLVMGNFSIMPVLAKTHEGRLSQEDDVNDYILQVNYENPETELQVGLIYQARRSTSGKNSNDISPFITGGEDIIQSGKYKVDSYNAFISQWIDQVKLAFELGVMTGNLGLFKNSAEIEQDGLGAAMKLWWSPKGARWGTTFDLGYASGDNPATKNVYESYIFDQNYDVAFLLFNHPMGARDFFRTAQLRNTAIEGKASTLSAQDSFDSEAISNTTYVSAAFQYKLTEKMDLESRLTYAMLNSDPLETGVDSNAGFELDLTFNYKPFKGFQWMNRAGVFAPGASFKGGSDNLPIKTAFGFETKAAISF